MSKEAPQWFVDEQSDEIIRRYQSDGGIMSGTHRRVKKIDGDRLTLRKIGKRKVRPLLRGSRAKRANVKMGKITIETEACQDFYEILEDDVEQMSPDDRDANAKESASAFGREKDRVCYEAMDEGHGQYDQVVGDYSKGLDPTMCLKACNIMQERDVPWDGQICCPLPSLQWNRLLTYKVFANADWVDVDMPFAKKMTAKHWNGVYWFMAYNDLFSRLGLPKREKGVQPEKDRFYMYHHDALASGDVYDIRSDTVWDNDITGWTVNNRMRMGAMVLDKDGIVEFNIKGNAPIPELA